mmetsp:Transcript_29842/g.88625  ORF Transcript_29842/g.88625 Transcript_29842/m.88625 type:complete len:216 (-) Transcript_29842:51-698(-)
MRRGRRRHHQRRGGVHHGRRCCGHGHLRRRRRKRRRGRDKCRCHEGRALGHRRHRRVLLRSSSPFSGPCTPGAGQRARSRERSQELRRRGSCSRCGGRGDHHPWARSLAVRRRRRRSCAMGGGVSSMQRRLLLLSGHSKILLFSQHRRLRGEPAHDRSHRIAIRADFCAGRRLRWALEAAVAAVGWQCLRSGVRKVVAHDDGHLVDTTGNVHCHR